MTDTISEDSSQNSCSGQKQISFCLTEEECKSGFPREDIICVVDTLKCKIEPPLDSESKAVRLKLWNGESKIYCLKYEGAILFLIQYFNAICLIPKVAVSMCGRIVWFRGPFWGSQADCTIARESGFDAKLTQLGYFAIGDSAYGGLDRVIKAPKTMGKNVSDDPAVLAAGYQLHSRRVFVECWIKRFRSWGIMDAWPFRQKWHKHAQIAAACAKLTAIAVELAPLKTSFLHEYNHKNVDSED